MSEILFPQPAQEVVNFQQRQATAATVTAQRIVLPQGLVDSHPTQNNYALAPGHFGDYVNQKPAVMTGAPGTTLGKGTYKSTVQASTVQHTGAVTLHPTAQGQWISSQFAAVSVLAGAKAVYTNCRFSGVLDNSAGKAADVRCIGCFFDAPPVNVTVVA